jgi:hypothetical protein
LREKVEGTRRQGMAERTLKIWGKAKELGCSLKAVIEKRIDCWTLGRSSLIRDGWKRQVKVGK